MRRNRVYEAPRTVRTIPLSLEERVCNSSIFVGNNSVNTTGQQIENKDYDTDFNPIWK